MDTSASNSIQPILHTSMVCKCHMMQDSHANKDFILSHDNNDSPLKVEKIGYDWPNILIAIAAVGGLFSRCLYSLIFHPCLKFKKAERYNYTMPSPIPESDSQNGDNSETKEFYVPIKNDGRRSAVNVSVSVDCILENGGDGDSYNARYVGMPMQMEWRNREVSITIAAHDDAYFRFASFAVGTSSDNTPDAETEEYVACSICAKCGSGSKLLLSRSKAITVLARISVRAENKQSAVTKWISLHWSGGTSLSDVSDEKFKIRIAEQNEVNKANRVYNGIIKKGGTVQ